MLQVRAGGSPCVSLSRGPMNCRDAEGGKLGVRRCSLGLGLGSESYSAGNLVVGESCDSQRCEAMPGLGADDRKGCRRFWAWIAGRWAPAQMEHCCWPSGGGQRGGVLEKGQVGGRRGQAGRWFSSESWRPRLGRSFQVFVFWPGWEWEALPAPRTLFEEWFPVPCWGAPAPWALALLFLGAGPHLGLGSVLPGGRDACLF